jgi:hypothetical protein
VAQALVRPRPSRQFKVPGSAPRFVALQLKADVWKFAIDATAMSAASTQATAPASPPSELDPESATPPSELDPESAPPSLGLLPLLLLVLPLLLPLPLPPPVPLLPLVLLPLLPPLLPVAPSPVLPLPPLLPDSESVATPESGLPPEMPLEPHAYTALATRTTEVSC